MFPTLELKLVLLSFSSSSTLKRFTRVLFSFLGLLDHTRKLLEPLKFDKFQAHDDYVCSSRNTLTAVPCNVATSIDKSMLHEKKKGLGNLWTKHLLASLSRHIRENVTRRFHFIFARTESVVGKRHSSSNEKRAPAVAGTILRLSADCEARTLAVQTRSTLRSCVNVRTTH